MLLNGDLSHLMLIIPLFMIAIGFHEAAHAYTAHYFGDQTPKEEGRLTLNPLAHLDLFGSLMLVMAGFGWGKSVNVDPRQLRNATLHMPLIAAAGPGANFVLAVLSMLGLAMVRGTSLAFLGEALMLSAWLNAFLMFLNLIPIPPLDGSKVVRPLLPSGLGRRYDELAPYGIVIFLALIFVPGVSTVFMGTLQGLTTGTLGLIGALFQLG